MLENRDEIRAAVAKIAEGRLTVWNARLDLAVRAGAVNKIDGLLAHSPVADGHNCDCNCAMDIPFRDVALPEGK